MIIIEKMNSSHLDRVMLVENSSFSSPWGMDAFVGELSYDGLTHYLVAISDDKVIGYAGAWACGEDVTITNIAVIPEHRRRGVGEALFSALICDTKGKGGLNWTLEVRKSNGAAINLYKKKGFEIIGERKKYYPDGEDAYVMKMTDNKGVYK